MYLYIHLAVLPSWRKENSAVAGELKKRPRYASEAWLDCYQEGDGATAGELENRSRDAADTWLDWFRQGIKRLDDNNRLKSILFQKNYFERELN